MTWTQNEMNGAKDTEPAATLKPLHQKLGETASRDRLAGAQPVAVIGTADAGLAQRLSRELERSVPRQVIALAGGLTQLRELLKTCSPSVIFLDTDLLGGLPLLDTVRPLAASVPVLVLASLNAQADIAKLVADERIDFVARAGDFVPLASAMIARRLNHPSKPISSTDAPQPGSSGMSEIFRHEINNPLTGILGNTELVLAHREHFSGVEVQRLQTVVDLAVRLRERFAASATPGKATARRRRRNQLANYSARALRTAFDSLRPLIPAGSPSRRLGFTSDLHFHTMSNHTSRIFARLASPLKDRKRDASQQPSCRDRTEWLAPGGTASELSVQDGASSGKRTMPAG